MMNLCRITPGFPEKEEGGGVELHVYNLTREQRKLGLDIDIITAGQKEGSKTVDGVNIHRVKRSSPFQLTSGFRLLQTAERLAAEKNFDALQIHNPLVLPFLPNRIGRIPLVFSIHATLMDYKNLFSFKSFHRSLKGFLEFRFIAKKLCEKAGRITTGSSDEKYELSKFLGIDEEKIVPVLGKADPKFFRPGIRSNLKERLGVDGPVILSVGRFMRKKGYTYLINAFRKVVSEIPDANLVLVGHKEGDQELKTIENLVKSFGLTRNVRLLPAVTKQELLHYYSMCDVYVQPSISEGFPQTVQDAMCCEKPVIATAAYGPKDVIQNGYNGFLVPRRDSEILAQRIIELLKDEKKMRLFGRRNRKMAIEKLDWKVTAKIHYQVCKDAAQ